MLLYVFSIQFQFASIILFYEYLESKMMKLNPSSHL